MLTLRAGWIAQWLERRTRDRKVAGSIHGESGGSFYFLLKKKKKGFCSGT